MVDCREAPLALRALLVLQVLQGQRAHQAHQPHRVHRVDQRPRMTQWVRANKHANSHQVLTYWRRFLARPDPTAALRLFKQRWRRWVAP